MREACHACGRAWCLLAIAQMDAKPSIAALTHPAGVFPTHTHVTGSTTAQHSSHVWHCALHPWAAGGV